MIKKTIKKNSVFTVFQNSPHKIHNCKETYWWKQADSILNKWSPVTEQTDIMGLLLWEEHNITAEVFAKNAEPASDHEETSNSNWYKSKTQL